MFDAFTYLFFSLLTDESYHSSLGGQPEAGRSKPSQFLTDSITGCSSHEVRDGSVEIDGIPLANLDNLPTS